MTLFANFLGGLCISYLVQYNLYLKIIREAMQMYLRQALVSPTRRMNPDKNNLTLRGSRCVLLEGLYSASCELSVASCELSVASCQLRVGFHSYFASCELRVASCELRVASCELRVASWFSIISIQILLFQF